MSRIVSSVTNCNVTNCNLTDCMYSVSGQFIRISTAIAVLAFNGRELIIYGIMKDLDLVLSPSRNAYQSILNRKKNLAAHSIAQTN